MRGLIRRLVRRLTEWVNATFEPLIVRLVQVGLVQSAIVLAAQTFMALFPLLIAVIAVAPTSVGRSIADALRDRLGISGDSEDSVQRLIGSHSQLHGAITIFGVLLVLASATSFTRALQRVYEAAWQLPKLGLKGSLRGLLWLFGLLAYFALAAGAVKLTTAAGEAASPLRWIFTVVSSFLLWWWTPFLLLGGRVRARALLPGSLLTSAAVLILGAVSSAYLPRAITSQESRYGAIGAVFALESWLVVLAGAIVGAAVVGAVGAQYPAGPMGRWIRGTPDPEGWRRNRPSRNRPSRNRPGRKRSSRNRPSPDQPDSSQNESGQSGSGQSGSGQSGSSQSESGQSGASQPVGD